MNAATEASTALVTRHVGICQICEAEHKLTTDALCAGLSGSAEHKVVHHGYQRPGCGSIVGDCWGVGELPFEVSCEATKRYLGHVLASREAAKARLARLQAGEVTELREPSWRRGQPDAVFTPASPEWSRKLASAIRGVEQEIEQIGREVARLEAMIARWVPSPLRTVDEVEGLKADAKRAAKAARDADYQARTEAKIASYRKRLATARKNRTTSTIADIFDSAPRQLGDRGLTRAQAFEAIGSAEVFAAFGLDTAATHRSDPAADRRNDEICSIMKFGTYANGQTVPCAWPAALA